MTPAAVSSKAMVLMMLIHCLLVLQFFCWGLVFDPYFDVRYFVSYLVRPPDRSAYWKKYFSYFSTKTYVVSTQKNRLNETVLLSTQKHMLKLIGKETNAILDSETILIWTYVLFCNYLADEERAGLFISIAF